MRKFTSTILIVSIMILFFLACSGPSDKQADTSIIAPKKVISKEEYIAETKKIGEKKSAIYYKDFLKNPIKYKGEKVNVLGRIFQIEESKDFTALQMYVTNDYKSVIVYYPGTMQIYEKDIINVYGEVGDIFEGTNAFGAKLSAPTITAKYIVKKGTAGDY